MSLRILPRGIYVPLPCFFETGSEDLDLESYEKHVRFTTLAGTIPVVSGTMGEAPHLSRSERQILIRATRKALDEVNLTEIPIVAGCSMPGTRESILLCKEAAAAGADFVIALTPGFYSGSLAANEVAVKNYFIDIATASPIPVMMYNFPVMSGGVDLSSDLIIDIAKRCPNVCCVKLTCGNVGKLTRITAVVDSTDFTNLYPRKNSHPPFMVIDGFIDFLLPSIASNASGAITGLANIAPKSCVKLWQLCQVRGDPVSFKKAQELQNLISTADGVALKIGIEGMKGILAKLFGYCANPRLPLTPMPMDEVEQILICNEIKHLLNYESTLI